MAPVRSGANVLNPKAALFFVAVLPQFVSSDSDLTQQILILGLLDVALGVVWWTVFVAAVRAAHRVMGSSRSRVVIDWVAGSALITLGGALAFSGRRMA